MLTGIYRKIIHVAGFISILAFVCFLNSTAFFPSAANNDGEQGNDMGADPIMPIVEEQPPAPPAEEPISPVDPGVDLQPAGAEPDSENPLPEVLPQEAQLPDAPLPVDEDTENEKNNQDKEKENDNNGTGNKPLEEGAVKAITSSFLYHKPFIALISALPFIYFIKPSRVYAPSPCITKSMASSLSVLSGKEEGCVPPIAIGTSLL